MADPTAQPKRGTVMKTALCRNCNEVLYNDGSGWMHDTGDEFCEVD